MFYKKPERKPFDNNELNYLYDRTGEITPENIWRLIDTYTSKNSQESIIHLRLMRHALESKRCDNDQVHQIYLKAKKTFNRNYLEYHESQKTILEVIKTSVNCHTQDTIQQIMFDYSNNIIIRDALKELASDSNTPNLILEKISTFRSSGIIRFTRSKLEPYYKRSVSDIVDNSRQNLQKRETIKYLKKCFES